MKKMKIGIVVIGDCYTVAAEERAVENQDLRKASEYRADRTFLPLTETPPSVIICL